MNSAPSIKTRAHFSSSSFLSQAAFQIYRFLVKNSVCLSQWHFFDSSSLFGLKEIGYATLSEASWDQQLVETNTSESTGSHDCNQNILRCVNPTQEEENVAHGERRGGGAGLTPPQRIIRHTKTNIPWRSRTPKILKINVL